MSTAAREFAVCDNCGREEEMPDSGNFPSSWSCATFHRDGDSHAWFEGDLCDVCTKEVQVVLTPMPVKEEPDG